MFIRVDNLLGQGQKHMKKITATPAVEHRFHLSLCCQKCRKPFDIDDLNTCLACRNEFCEHCVCACNPQVPIQSVVAAAVMLVLSSSTLAKTRAFPNFVIEDEFGGLLWVQGNISNVAPFGHQLDQIFAHSLPTENQSAYKVAQLSVWFSGTPTSVWEKINTVCVEILPLLLVDRFTVSIFSGNAPCEHVH